MASDPMSSTKAVRREDLFQNAATRDGNGVHSKDGRDEAAAAAAQAELDAYMKGMLGLQFDIPEPQPREKQEPLPAPKPASKPVPKPSAKKDDKSDVDMDSSDDDEETEPEATNGPAEPTATEFVFRLFSSSGKAAPIAAATAADSQDAAPQPAAPIVLLDDNADGTPIGAGAIMEPRPLGHYVVGELSDAARERYAEAAISGDDILAQASPAIRNTWGLEVPWRARTVLKASPAQLRALLANSLAPGKPAPANLPAALAAAINSLPAWAGGSPPQGLPAGLAGLRKRPGKKQRIILRQRDKARREKEAAEAAKAQSKEEQISEKKKRLNRLKKLRRREKAKSTKAGGSEAGGADSGDGAGDD
ncbi:hypothetical protein F503_08849 [Ophiostoma piceae UAMH 11346]|uniref:Uncharacterized protein n=1 Tax=Ophiostoma piceae (strain UAMH 11346) TaxID=1262450 RepID=S3BRA4_OPHP1|nr:hypothetical protein F503_08849 [Ophiostoma piceae UAMH 11346]